MPSITVYLISIFVLAILSGGWVAVQLLARKMRTKNHIEHGGSCGNGCTCMGTEGEGCERSSFLK